MFVSTSFFKPPFPSSPTRSFLLSATPLVKPLFASPIAFSLALTFFVNPLFSSPIAAVFFSTSFFNPPFPSFPTRSSLLSATPLVKPFVASPIASFISLISFFNPLLSSSPISFFRSEISVLCCVIASSLAFTFPTKPELALPSPLTVSINFFRFSSKPSLPCSPERTLLISATFPVRPLSSAPFPLKIFSISPILLLSPVIPSIFVFKSVTFFLASSATSYALTAKRLAK